MRSNPPGLGLGGVSEEKLAYPERTGAEAGRAPDRASLRHRQQQQERKLLELAASQRARQVNEGKNCTCGSYIVGF